MATPAPARLDIIAPASLDREDRAEWTRLADRAADPNPFLRPEFVLPAARTCAPDVALAVVRSGRGWIACLPVRRRLRHRRLAMPCLAPWLPAYAYYAAPLVALEALEPGVEALLGLLRRPPWSATLVLESLDPATAVGTALLDAAGRRGMTTVVRADFARAELRRRPEATYLQEAVSAQGRKKLRKAARLLGEALGGTPEVVDRAGDPAAVEAFLALEATGWKATHGRPILHDDAEAGFFRAMCEEVAAAGRLQLLSLQVGERVAAMQCDLRDGPDLYAFKVAHDPALRAASPGTVLEVAAIERFHATPGLERVDSCAAPDSPLVNRLWPDRRRVQDVLVARDAGVGAAIRAAVRADRGAVRAYRRASPWRPAR